MNNINSIDRLLAIVTLGMLFLAFLLIGSRASAQDRFIERIGTTFDEVASTTDRYPYVLKTADSDGLIRLNNEFLAVVYEFNQGHLDRMLIHRTYSSRKMAKAGAEGYMIYLERIAATIVPVVNSDETSIYYATKDDTAYELVLNNTDRNQPTLRIKSWRRSIPNETIEEETRSARIASAIW